MVSVDNQVSGGGGEPFEGNVMKLDGFLASAVQ